MSTKDGNPKDGIGAKKWRKVWFVPDRVLWEVAVAFLEGALKYGAFNWRAAGVRASVYLEAAKGHMDQFKEGEDIDAESRCSHIDKAIASLMILRDSMLHGNWIDDRPPRHARLDAQRADLQERVDWLFEKYPESKEGWTEERMRSDDGCDTPRFRPRGPWADKALKDFTREDEIEMERWLNSARA